MKILKIILLTLVLLTGIAGTVIFIFVKTFDVNKYKTQITRQLSSWLGREVHLGQMALGVSAGQGLNISVQGLSVADDPQFSSGEIFRADVLYLSVDAGAFLARKEIFIPKIDLRNPRLNLIRNSDGRINAQEIFSRRPNAAASLPLIRESARLRQTAQDFVAAAFFTGPSAAFAEEKESSAKAPVSQFWIHSLQIHNGTVIFTDKSFDPPLTIPLEGITLETTDISLNAPFKFQGNCSLWSAGQNIRMEGSARIDADSSMVRLERLRLETDMSQLLLQKIPYYAVLREAMKMEDKVLGRLVVDVPQAVLGAGGIVSLSLNGRLTDGRLAFDGPGSPLEDIHFNAAVTESRLDVADTGFSCASGKVRLDGRLEDYWKEQRFFFDLKVEDVQLSDWVPLENMPVIGDAENPVRPQGRIYADFGVQGQGLDPASLKTRLKGEGAFELKEGKIENVNLLRFVLNKIAFIPDLVPRIEESLPPQYLEKLDREETVLEEAKFEARIEDSVLLINNAALNADGFLLSAQGTLDLDQNLTLEAAFDITPDLASSMMAAVEELAYLSDAQGRIHIPFKPYEGKLAEFRIYPDIEDLGRQAIQSKGRDELKRVILDAIGIEDEKSAPPQDGRQDLPPQDEQQEKRPEEILIDGVLDAIFKGGQTF